MAEEQKGFWTSIPGILTGLATVLTAITGLYMAMSGDARHGQDDQVLPAPTVSKPEQAKSAPEPPRNMSQRPKEFFHLTAVIDDPDGFTNLRSQKSASSEVVARVNQGEQFFTYPDPQEGGWWQVMTSDGKVGYMHVSRIKIVSPR